MNGGGPWPVIAFAYSIKGFVSLVFFGGEGNFCPSPSAHGRRVSFAEVLAA
jgi:hypothetical protein